MSIRNIRKTSEPVVEEVETVSEVGVEEKTDFTLQEAFEEEVEVVFDEGVEYVPTRRKPKYPFAQMRPGQSIFLPGKAAKDLSSGLSRINNDLNMYLVPQERTENGVLGCRVFCRDPNLRVKRAKVVRKKKAPAAAAAAAAAAEENKVLQVQDVQEAPEVLQDLT